jgi:polyhydroxybutyrate depolymerase
MTVRRVGVSIVLGALLAACSAGPAVSPSSGSGAPSTGAAGSAGSAGVAAEGLCGVPPGKSTPVTWSIDGAPRSALVHRPATASDAKALPVVVALHGYGGFGIEMEQTSELSDASDAQGWLVVYPEGTGTPEAWDYDPAGTGHAADMAFLRRLIDDVIRLGCGDPKRVIATGISQGGWLSDMVGCEMTDLVAGVVPVAGRDMGWSCKPKKPIPFTAVNGVLDDALPYKGGPVNAPPPLTSVDSVDEWLAARATSRGCVGKPTEATSSAHVVLETWSGCTAPVSLYRVEDGGHSWPNGGGYGAVDHELSVTKVIAEMLAGT